MEQNPEEPVFENSPETETSIEPTQASENMEVHHHAHHDHGKKTWKSYFWEFFMLFLAVFCGFMAEIQVEHYIEHQREHKYMQMYMEDLRADSVRFERVIEGNNQRLSKLDELVTLINSPIQNDSIVLKMYDVYSRSIGFMNFLFNKRTLSQLKSAGGYKLIRAKAVADSLIVRDIDVDWNDWTRQRLHEYFGKLRDNGEEIFDEYQLYQYRKSLAPDINTAIDSAMISNTAIKDNQNKKFTLLTDSKILKSKLSSSVIYFQRVLFRYNQDLISYQKKCQGLINMIQKEYDLE